jgi:hypothetical protein
VWRRAWANEPGVGDDAGAAVPAGDEAVHGLQIERHVIPAEAADEEGVGGGVAPRSLQARVSRYRSTGATTSGPTGMTRILLPLPSTRRRRGALGGLDGKVRVQDQCPGIFPGRAPLVPD